MSDENRWVAERSSGYQGWRCTICATWVLWGQPLVCDCNRKQKKSNDKEITQYEYANAIEKIHGYYIPRPDEKPEDAINRAKLELIAVLDRQIEVVKRVPMSKMLEKLK